MPRRDILGCPSTQEIVTLTATFSVTSTCPFLEREAQFSALAQDQHHWQALCDAVGFEIIGEILREDDDPVPVHGASRGAS